METEFKEEELSKIKALYPNVSAVENVRILCTSCFKDIKHVILLKRKCYAHPILNVVVCKKCFNFYGSGEFSVDEDGSDKYCRWCGQGGNLYLCNNCPRAFCPKCIKKNLDRAAVKEVESDLWKCPICEPTPILKHRALLWAIVTHLDNLKKNQLSKAPVRKKTKALAKKALPKAATSSSVFDSNINARLFPNISFDSEPSEIYLDQAKKYLKEYSFNCIKFLEEALEKVKALSSDNIKTFEDFKRTSSKYHTAMNVNATAFSDFAETMVGYVTSWAQIVTEDGSSTLANHQTDEIMEISPEALMVTSDITISEGDRGLEHRSVRRPLNSREGIEEEETSIKEEIKIPFIRVKNLNELKEKVETIDISTSDSEKDELPSNDRQENSSNAKSTSDKNTKGKEDQLPENSQSKLECKARKSTEKTKLCENNENSNSQKEKMNFSEKVFSTSQDEEDNGKVPKLEISEPQNKSVVSSADDSSCSDPLSSGKTSEDQERNSSKKKVKKTQSNGKETLKRKRKPSEALFSSSSEDDLEKLWNFASITKGKSSTKSSANKMKCKSSKKKESDLFSSDLSGSDNSSGKRSDTSAVEFDSGEDLTRLLEDNFENDDLNGTPRPSDILKEVLEMCSETSESEAEDEPAGVKGKSSSLKAKRNKKGYTDSILQASLDENKKTKSRQKFNIIDSSSESGDDAKKKSREKSKGIKQLIGSDESSTASEDDKSSDSHDSLVPIKKKRRFIKMMSSDSSDNENGDKWINSSQDTSSKGRKNIKKILDEKKLEDTTKEALALEKERKERIAEKQRLYNQLMQMDKERHEELSEVVLDFNPKTKEKLLCVHPDLVKKLKPHQADGIKFMWDACFESIELSKKKKGSGCILAHCMGLGKTLQVVAFLHTILTHAEVNACSALVICPFSTVLNWVNEFKKWLSDIGSGEDVDVYHLSKVAVANRASQLKEWQRTGGVMIMGYNLFRTLTGVKSKGKKNCKQAFKETLLDPGPDVVICDEGHVLKNESSALSICTNKIRTARRIVLTGTPLQNNLIEYHCMVQFVKPNLLGTKKEFKNRFVNPINNGQFEDSTSRDVKIMKRRAHVLHTMLDGVVQRKDYNVLTPYLPPKFEYVIFLKLSEIQSILYKTYLEICLQTESKQRQLFTDFQTFLWICLHPRSLLMKQEKTEKKNLLLDEEGSLKNFINDSDSSDSDSSSSSAGDDSSRSASSSSHKRNGKSKNTRKDESSDVEIVPPENENSWWSSLLSEDHLEGISESTKMFLFFTILKLCEEIGDKLLVFSQTLYTLDIIEHFLEKVDSSTQADEPDPHCAGFTGSWCKGLDYFRLDGATNSENRDKFCKLFNDPENVRQRLFLISTRAGGLGINLTGANRVIIFDASWNPSYDVQSLFRIYRFGQMKPCYIYRFLSKGTMEEKIYERQVAKLSTSLRVVDEHQIERHFSHSSMTELYSYSPGMDVEETPVLPKDRLMAELFQTHKDIILAHHQHDSLLENKEEEELTEEERKAAWAEFEQEKTMPLQYANPGTSFGMNHGAGINNLNNFLLEIQEAVRKNKPHLSPEEVRRESITIIKNNPTFNQLYSSAFSDVFNTSTTRIRPENRSHQQLLHDVQQQFNGSSATIQMPPFTQLSQFQQRAFLPQSGQMFPFSPNLPNVGHQGRPSQPSGPSQSQANSGVIELE